ncbi:unnamed protein product [Calypogeia fissa]
MELVQLDGLHGAARYKKLEDLEHSWQGATCATVLTKANFSEGYKCVAAGMKAMALRRDISLVVGHLKTRAKMISTTEEVAFSQIGGASEVEVSEKDVATDALKAISAAAEEGIVPGEGVTLLYPSRELEEIQSPNFNQKVGVQIFQNALKMPAYTTAQTCGVEGAVVVGKCLEQQGLEIGYHVAKGSWWRSSKDAGSLSALGIAIVQLFFKNEVYPLPFEHEKSGKYFGAEFSRKAGLQWQILEF